MGVDRDPPKQGGGTSERQLVLCLSVCRGASNRSSWKVVSLRLLRFLAHPSTWLRLWPSRSSEEPRTTRGSWHSLSRLIFIRLAGWTFCWLHLTASGDWIDFRNFGSPLELTPGSGRCCCSSSELAAVAASSTRRPHRPATFGC